jgi:hypothetical protein
VVLAKSPDGVGAAGHASGSDGRDLCGRGGKIFLKNSVPLWHDLGKAMKKAPRVSRGRFLRDDGQIRT